MRLYYMLSEKILLHFCFILLSTEILLNGYPFILNIHRKYIHSRNIIFK